MKENIAFKNIVIERKSKLEEAKAFFQEFHHTFPYVYSDPDFREFDWDACRLYCRSGKSYSTDKFAEFVGIYFDVDIEEFSSVKNQSAAKSKTA